MDQQRVMQAYTLQRESQELQCNITVLDKELAELNAFHQHLNIIAATQEKEMLASLGKGIHVAATLNKESKLLVDVGAGVLVRKTPQETQNDMSKQMKRLSEVRMHLVSKLELYQAALHKLLEQIQQEQKKETSHS